MKRKKDEKRKRSSGYEIIMERDFSRKAPGVTAEEPGWENNVVSSGECTGLTPTPPVSPEETESYRDIYAVPEAERQP